MVGDGNQVRDFTYVSDVVQAFILAGESQLTGEAINIGTQNPQSVNRLADLLGGKVEFIPKRPGEPDITHADITKAKKLLDWEPQITFEEGVRNVLSQINMWKDAPLWSKKKIETVTKTWFKHLS